MLHRAADKEDKKFLCIEIEQGIKRAINKMNK